MADATTGSSGLRAFLGYGITRPFVRDQKNDFASGGDIALVKSCVGQILGTKAMGPDGRGGELPWRHAFGSLLYRLRHRNISAMTAELARVYAQDALVKWEPRVVVTSVAAAPDPLQPRTLAARVTFDVIDRNVAGNQVIVSGLEVTVPVSA